MSEAPGPHCDYCGTELEGAPKCPNFGSGPEHAGLSTAAKIKAIEESGFPLAFDGCHKIYFLQDEARRAQAVAYGYDITPSTDLRQHILDSCGLVFVSRWGFDNDDFEHEWNIDQCTQNIYVEAEKEPA